MKFNRNGLAVKILVAVLGIFLTFILSSSYSDRTRLWQALAEKHGKVEAREAEERLTNELLRLRAEIEKLDNKSEERMERIRQRIDELINLMRPLRSQ